MILLSLPFSMTLIVDLSVGCDEDDRADFRWILAEQAQPVRSARHCSRSNLDLSALLSRDGNPFFKWAYWIKKYLFSAIKPWSKIKWISRSIIVCLSRLTTRCILCTFWFSIVQCKSLFLVVDCTLCTNKDNNNYYYIHCSMSAAVSTP